MPGHISVGDLGQNYNGGNTLGDRLVAEVDAPKGAHDRWLARRRTTVGLSGLGMPEIFRNPASSSSQSVSAVNT
jgi:hypothetical protein